MKIVRHCRERLPGGARLWRSLAKQAGFSGTLRVIGYGVGNSEDAVEHRKNKNNNKAGIALARIVYADNTITVYTEGKCSKILASLKMKADEDPLFCFAHELGHFEHNRDDKTNTERTADMYARRVLKGIE